MQGEYISKYQKFLLLYIPQNISFTDSNTSASVYQ